MECPKCIENSDSIEMEAVEVINRPTSPLEEVETSMMLECPLCGYQDVIASNFEETGEDDLMDREFNFNLVEHPELLTI